ncbi:MAG: hypothetical protein GC159_14835 [Phycisphaera sp.]|nr:hypothetical protein [Phycisphaera sp.]
MAYFPDLTPCHYRATAMRDEDWNCPLLAVGWLEYPHEYTRCDTPDHDLLDMLAELREQFVEATSSHAFRGIHTCGWCERRTSPSQRVSLEWTNYNMWVPGDACIYLAPASIEHYMAMHNYAPPREFIDAVHVCPDPREPIYRELLTDLNDGAEPPLRPPNWKLPAGPQYSCPLDHADVPPSDRPGVLERRLWEWHVGRLNRCHHIKEILSRLGDPPKKHGDPKYGHWHYPIKTIGQTRYVIAVSVCDYLIRHVFLAVDVSERPTPETSREDC